ncbi:MAG: hypothetical protein P0S96_07765 [Simkaniaceae bacterium]|nr:hypothetical protein [Candidatus Sacchlamyda saccharinae]
MNFTREPIIETIITPKDGHKLVIRNTKGSGGEEHIVDAVEVISFGHSFFFRSVERPKPFLVPVTDYEVVEAKETRVVLKNATFERSIKIGGGKKAEPQEPAAVEERLEKKRERRRHRRRRTPEEVKASEEEAAAEDQKPVEEKAPEGGGAEDETPKVSSSPVSRLIPPPPTLISDKIAKEKAEAPKEPEGDVLPEPVAEEKPKRGRRKKAVVKKEEPKEEVPSAEDAAPPSEEEGGDMQRVAQEPLETVSSTSFSAVEDSKNNSFFGKIW